MSQNIDARHFPAALRTLRKRRQLSQAALGKLVDMRQFRISRIESRWRNPSLDEAVRLAKALDANLYDFLQEIPPSG